MAKNQYQLVTFFLNGKEVEKMVDIRPYCGTESE